MATDVFGGGRSVRISANGCQPHRPNTASSILRKATALARFGPFVNIDFNPLYWANLWNAFEATALRIFRIGNQKDITFLGIALNLI